MSMQKAERLKLPHAIYLESTNRCNLGCQTCVRTFQTNESERDLDLQTQTHVLEQLPEIERVVLHGIGEPLLNRDLDQLIRDAKGRGAHVVFNSNGTLLTKRKARGLIDSGLDEYRLSLDAATPETYEKVRGADMFYTILENVRQLQMVKRDLGVSHPTVSVWITGMQENIGELPSLIKLAVDLQCDEVNLQRLVYFGEGLAVEAQNVFSAFEERLAQVISEASALCKASGIAFRASGNIEGDSYAMHQLESSQAERPWSKCMRPWSLTYVTANGNVLPCCISPWVAEEYDDIVLGNVHNASMEEIWNGERYNTFRARLGSDNPPPSCKNCGVAWSL